ncbi:MAG: hypothetical protein AAGI68_16730 [Planctomycetota bacterium]
MPNYKSYRELIDLDEDELISNFDAWAPNTNFTVYFVRDELHRRQMARQEQRMLRLTRYILWLTLANVALVLLTFITTFL